MNLTNWDAEGHEIKIDGKLFFVSAVFDWERDSVDYQFDARSGQGRDRIGMVACDVLALEIWGEDDALAIEIAHVKEISARILREFRNSEAGCRPVGWGAWM